MSDNTNQVAIVTGCGRSNGIGAAIVRRLAANGIAVAATDLATTGTDDLDSLIEDINNNGGRAIACRGDVSSETDTANIINQTVEQLGGITILVNNAGAPQGGDRVLVSEVPLFEWQRQIDINLTGQFLMIRAATPHMLEGNYGRIVNIASAVAQTGIAKRAAYAASKSGILGLTRSVAAELSPEGITVNAIMPGAIATSRATATSQREAGDNTAEEAFAKRALSNPTRRHGAPEDIAAAVGFLTSPDAGYITGQILAVDGGGAVLRT